MINERYVHFKKYSDFLKQKIGAESGNTQYTLGDTSIVYEGAPDISYQSVIYIKDKGIIFTHSGKYSCGENAFYTERYDFTQSSTLAYVETSGVTYNETEKAVDCEADSEIKLTFPRQTTYFVTLYKKSAEGENPTVTCEGVAYDLKDVTSFYVSGVFSTVLTFSNPTVVETITIQETDMRIPTKVSELENDLGYLMGSAENETLILKDK